MFSDYSRAERHQRQLCKFEALQSERYADDRNAKYQAYRGGFDCERYAEEYQPQYVCDKRYRPAAVLDLASEREKAKFREFKALDPERYSHNCQTADQSRQCPSETQKKSAEQKPDYIAKTAHNILLKFIYGQISKSACPDMSVFPRRLPQSG